MANYGLVQLQKGERGRLALKVLYERIELELPLAGQASAA